MRFQLVACVTAIQCLTLILLALIVTGVLWLSPCLWMFFSSGFPNNLQTFRYLVLLNFLMFWLRSTADSFEAIIGLYRNSRSNFREWMMEVAPERHALVAELLRFVETSVSERLRGRVQVCLSFAPVVDYRRNHCSAARPWQLVIGLPTIAVLSVEEIKALLLQRGIELFKPPTLVHPWLHRLHLWVSRWHSALPPDPGLFSLVHNLLGYLVRILQSIPRQVEQWSHAKATETISRPALDIALDKLKLSVFCLRTYAKLYDSAVSLGSLPPFTEGFLHLFSQFSGQTSTDPAFTRWDGFWACEWQFIQNLYGPERARSLQPRDWNNLLNELGPASWKKNVAQLQPALSGRCVADIPDLLTAWRSLLRKGFGAAVSSITPDLQRLTAISLLGSVFAFALFNTGWQPNCSFHEVSFIKDQRELAPFRLVSDLGNGRLGKEDFLQRCRDSSTADLPLS